MERVSATRNELLARRTGIGLAAQGRDLLKEKRTALMREFDRLSANAVGTRSYWDSWCSFGDGRFTRD